MDIFEKITGLNLSGDTYASEQRYRLVVIIITFILGLCFLPYSLVLWIITAVKIKTSVVAYLKESKNV